MPDNRHWPFNHTAPDPCFTRHFFIEGQEQETPQAWVPFETLVAESLLASRKEAGYARFVIAARFHDRVTANLAKGNHAPYRLPSFSLDVRQKMKDRGIDVARALQAEDEASLADIFSECGNAASLFASLVQRYDWVDDAFFLCPVCGEPERMDYSRSVIVDRYGCEEFWCESCADESSFTCPCCGNQFIDRLGRLTEDDGTICTRCRNDEYFECEGCGRVLHNDHYASDGMCDSCYENSEDDGDGDGLSDYHEASRSWTISNGRPDYPFLAAPPMGVELEVYAKGSRADAVDDVRCFDSDLILERDGSLCDEQGFEIITHPKGLHEWTTYGPALIDVLTRNRIVGWDAQNGSYGIHVTIHRKYLSPLQEARMSMFLAAEDNREFVQAIAQRRGIYSAAVNIGDFSRFAMAREVCGQFRTAVRHGKETKKLAGRGKYCPINYKTNLAEFRIFQSTTNLQSFMKCVEFVSALVEWTNPVTATGSKWYWRDFLTWLTSRPLATKHYPNLIGYLERDRYPVKGATVGNLLAPSKRRAIRAQTGEAETC